MQLGFASCALAFVSAYLFTWVARGVAPRWGWVDKPDGGRKLHARPTPLMGGLAIFLAMHLTLSAALMLGWYQVFDWGKFGLWLTCGAFCGLGLWDDRWPLRARTKFAWQVVCALPFVLLAEPITAVSAFGWTWHPGAAAIPFTVLWIVVCVNVVNLLDGLDGLATSVGIIAIGTLAAMSVLNGNQDMGVLCFTAAGALVGFLVHNWPPAKIFLGDAGSMSIGFLIGALSLVGSLKTAAGFTLVVPLVVLSVPIFDTTMAILRRKLSGRGIGEADRGHIHHRLQDRGYSRLQTLLVIGGLCLLTAAAAIAANSLRRDVVGAVMCVSVLLVVVVSGVFGDREMLMVFRHMWAVSTLVPHAHRAVGARLMMAKMQDAAPAERQKFWRLIEARFFKAGGTSVSIAWWRDQEPPVQIATADATEDAVLAEIAKWRFAYDIIRDDGTHVLLTTTGHSAEGLGGERLEDLFRLLDMVCRYWPLQELAAYDGFRMNASLRLVDELAETTPRSSNVRAA